MKKSSKKFFYQLIVFESRLNKPKFWVKFPVSALSEHPSLMSSTCLPIQTSKRLNKYVKASLKNIKINSGFLATKFVLLRCYIFYPSCPTDVQLHCIKYPGIWVFTDLY